MFDPKTFSFDVEKMTEFFKQNDFTKHLASMKLPGVDAEALMAAQQKNMDALVEANKAAAAGYQDLFKKQVAIFEETMAEAQKQMKASTPPRSTPTRPRRRASSPRPPSRRRSPTCRRWPRARRRRTPTPTRSSSARIKESMAELRDMATKTRA